MQRFFQASHPLGSIGQRLPGGTMRAESGLPYGQSSLSPRTAPVRRINLGTARVVCTMLLACLCAGRLDAQDASSSPPPASAPATESEPALTHRQPALTKPPASELISLTVPIGTPLRVLLDHEVRVEKVGQPIHGRTSEPLYAFDKLIVPVGAEVTGQISNIEEISGGKRTAAALDADFTPPHKIHVEFSELILPDGKHIPIRTVVTPGSGEVMQLVTAADEKGQKNAPPSPVAQKTKEAKESAKRDWQAAMKLVKEPGKMHKLGRYAVAQLPIHPQYIDAGTIYFAELQQPLDFGTEPMTPKMIESLNAAPPPGSSVRAILTTPLSSATTKKGDEVEAIVAQPLFDEGRLILPQGSRLNGTVLQVQHARRLSRNGQLRIVFHEISLPDGVPRKVEANLEGVQAGQDQHLKLDAEGGATATPSPTRFVVTAAYVGLGAVSFLGDTFGDTGPREAGSAGGYKLIGIGLGAAIHSQQFGMAMGVFGAGRSVYTNFIARGHDVVYPKNTAMEIGIGTRTGAVPKPAAQNPTNE